MSFSLTERAKSDFIDVYLYGVETFGAAQAERYAAELRTAFELIASQPRMCRERSEFTPPVRVHLHAAHAILYDIDGSDILIVRVLHRSRDLRRHV